MFSHRPEVKGMFIGSYPPVSTPGRDDKFFTNTYLLQENRKAEVVGPVSCRSVRQGRFSPRHKGFLLYTYR